MIYTYSVLKGYKAMNGTALIHLPLFIASLVYIQVPKGLGVAIDNDLESIFIVQLAIHIGCSLVWFMELNLTFWK
jgi:hypothetical protein